MCEKKHCCQKSAFLEPMQPMLNQCKQGRIHGRGSPTVKSKRVILFTMFLYSSENTTSKPIPNKTFVMFELSYCSRYMVILSSIALSQQCSEVDIISSYSSEAVMKLTTPLKYPPLTLLAGPAPAFKVRNCTVPPDHVHSEISFSRSCNFPKHWKNTKTRGSYLN